jgi:hypothetical protein
VIAVFNGDQPIRSVQIHGTLKYFDLEAGWMAEVIRMTTLAPDIIEAVLEGRQPRQLDLQRLRGRTSQLPREWSAQRKVFGFTS